MKKMFLILMLVCSVAGCISHPYAEDGSKPSFFNRITFGLFSATPEETEDTRFDMFYYLAAPLVAIGVFVVVATSADKIGFGFMASGAVLAVTGLILDKIAQLIGVLVVGAAICGVALLILKVGKKNGKTIFGAARTVERSKDLVP